MNKLVFIVFPLFIASCMPTEKEYDEYYGSGFTNVNEIWWSLDHTASYPFTVSHGEISCSVHPKFGRKVYFMPDGYTDESYIGTPLNKSASDFLEQNSMHPNVPYRIKKSADLSEAIAIGLKVCDEQQEVLGNNV